MESLQIIPKLNNTEPDCPVREGHCELKFDAENLRMVLRLSLLTLDPKPISIRADICCYDKNGQILSVIKELEYTDGGMMVELSSSMTVAVRIIVRRVEYGNGDTWESKLDCPTEIELSDDEVQSLEHTARFDVSKIVEMTKPEEKAKSKRAEKKALKKERIAEEEEIRRLIRRDPKERRKRIIGRLVALLVIAGIGVGGFYGIKYKTDSDTAYNKAMNLYNSGRFEEALPELEAAEQYRYFENSENELEWALAMCYSRDRNFGTAVKYFKKLGNYKESRANYRSIIDGYSRIVSAGGAHSLGLKADGTVLAAGDNSKGQCDVSGWNDIIAVSAGGAHSVGLKRDKTVVAAGDDSKRQCDVSVWDNIISVSAGTNHTVGVLNIGKVLATGDNTFGQCEVRDWSGIISASAGTEHTVGLKLDGTVVATGSNTNGECNVTSWTDMIQVVAGNGFTAGLKADGTILVCGSLKSVLEGKTEKRINDVKPDDVLMISAGEYNLLITTVDGKTVSVGGNESNQDKTNLWTGIVSASGGARHSVGVKADGTAVASGDNTNGQTTLDSWSGIGIPRSTVTIRKDKEE